MVCRVGLIALVFGIAAASAQNLELGGFGGYGVVAGDDQDRFGVGALGVSAGGPARGKHSLQFDYIFLKYPDRVRFDLHLATGSYVVQSRSGRARPFFKAGAGIGVRRFDRVQSSRLPVDLPALLSSDTHFTAILAGGITIDAGDRFFIRPQLQTYFLFGPAIALLPGVTVGFRF